MHSERERGRGRPPLVKVTHADTAAVPAVPVVAAAVAAALHRKV